MSLLSKYRKIKLESVDSWKTSAFREIIKNNKMTDDYHVGIRSVDDILTFAEAIEYSKEENYGESIGSNPDCPDSLYYKAIRNGRILVYSSYPIHAGTFVTPSRMMASDYAGNGKVYSKMVDLSDVAWVNADEGIFI